LKRQTITNIIAFIIFTAMALVGLRQIAENVSTTVPPYENKVLHCLLANMKHLFQDNWTRFELATVKETLAYINITV